MNTNEFIDFIPSFFEKLNEDHMSQAVIDTNKWVINHFKKYCLQNNIKEINMEAIKDFYSNQYDIDIYDFKCPMQSVLRRPLLIFIEYFETGSFYKSHQKSVKTCVDEKYFGLFLELQKEFINPQNIGFTSKERKLWIIAKFLNYLSSCGVNSISSSEVSHVSNYMNQISKRYAPASMRIHKTVLRETLGYLNNKGYITFTGRTAFPLIKSDNRRKLLTTYTLEEITKILNVIDTTTANGKEIYFIISLIAFLGLRVGDVINLKFENIDWENGQINIVQRKTNQLITLPLIDEVKFPLLDYLKNGRHPSIDEEYILTTLRAPYTKVNSNTTIQRALTKAMDLAGVSYEGKHHGAHSLRHSLATNMINNNVPINAISQVLGHSSSRTTEIYITKDTTHLRELSLEVPYAF